MTDDPDRTRPCIFVIDDDADLLGAMQALLTLEGWAVEVFDNIPAFICHVRPSSPGVLLLDVQLPGANGLDLQARLADTGDHRPIIFMTGHEQVSTAVHAMKGGALEFLIKPFREEALLSAVQKAAAQECSRLRLLSERQDLADRFGALTPREDAVMRHVVVGKLNKQIADEMALAEITVKVHRANMMHKLKVSSMAELIRLYDRRSILG